MSELLLLMQAWCASREVCISEAEMKLKKKNASPDDSKNIIIQLIDSGYIDEERYAKAFAGDKLRFDKWGPQKVRQALLMKKIPNRLIEAAITAKESEVDQDKIVESLLRKKFVSLKTLNNREIYPKLVRFGLSRGFAYPLVAKHAAQLIGSSQNFGTVDCDQ